MTPEDFSYFQQRVTRFISGTSLGNKSRSFGAPNIRRISLIPKRSLPQQLAEKLKVSSSGDDGISTSQRDVSSLGKITLNLEQTKNNLEKILQVISEDYKSSQDQNRKETEEYRKRIANRGRIFGKKELGDRKVDIVGGVKKYVGSFLSGTGGAIRALASFNLLQAILDKDPGKIIKSLLGIGITYLPAIGAGIAGAVATSFTKKLLGFGGRAAAPAATAATGAAGASRLGSLARFGGKAALVGSGLALASSMFRGGEEQNVPQQRLEELTQEQKASTQPSSLVPLPQNDLKRFEELNKKFEAALDFLLKKQREGSSGSRQSGGGGGGGGGGGTPTGQLISGPAPAEINALMSAISGGEGGLESVNAIGAMPGLSQMTIDQAIAKVEALRAQGKTSGAMGNMQQKSEFLRARTIAAGLDPATALFNAENQYKINRAYLASLFSGGEQEIVNLIRSGKISEVVNRLKGVWTSLPGANQQNVHTSSFYRNFETFLRQAGSSPLPISPTPRAASPRSIPSPSSQQPSFVLAPMPMGGSSGSPQASATAAVNDTVPEIDTSYSDNFLTMYSKLVYQIV